MDRKALLALISEDKREAVTAFLDSADEAARTAGKNSAGFEFRQGQKALKEAEAARDKAVARVTELEASAVDSAGASAKVKELESQLKTLSKERDSMLPIVTEHRSGLLRRAVVDTANLSDDLYADALIARLNLALGDDGNLPEDAAAKLTEWAADPANKGRVKTQSSRPTAQPLNQSTPLSDPLKAWAAKLPAHEREILTKSE